MRISDIVTRYRLTVDDYSGILQGGEYRPAGTSTSPSRMGQACDADTGTLASVAAIPGIGCDQTTRKPLSFPV